MESSHRRLSFPGHAGVILIMTGFFISLYCVLAFGLFGRGTPAPVSPPRKFVKHGLYRYSRNPMYIGYLTVFMGIFLTYRHLLLFAYFLFTFIALHLFVILYEEPELKKRFGEAYLKYAREVPRWL
jgi:protein-S-isoprenylcysteine O-methyltransferase Ste14